MTVNVSALDDFGNVTRLYSYFDPDVFTNDTTFTYDTAGMYQIIQVVGKDSLDGGKLDTVFIEVVEPQSPAIQVTQCSGLEVSVTSTDVFYDSIRIYFSPNDSVTLHQGASSSFQFSSADPQSIRLKGLFDNADEICTEYAETVTPIVALPVPRIVHASVKQSCRSQYALYLTLEQVETNVSYRVVLEQENTTTIFDGFLDSTYLVVQDIPFTVRDYCISVAAYDPCNGTSRTSNQFCSSPTILSLSPFETLYSSYQASSIYVNLDEVGLGTFEVERRTERGTFASRGTQAASFTDPIGSTSRKYFYRINYRDVCEEILFTAETHPPLVSANEVGENQYEIEVTAAENSLTTTSVDTYQVGSSGAVQSASVESTPFNINLVAENGTTQVFSLTSTYGETLSLQSNTLSLRYEFIVYVPSAFTPNGDGINDRLEFFGVPSSNANVKIYSRWGQTIYDSSDLSEGWDGMISGKRAQSGTYFYEIFFETTTGTILRQRGTFVIL